MRRINSLEQDGLLFILVLFNNYILNVLKISLLKFIYLVLYMPPNPISHAKINKFILKYNNLFTIKNYSKLDVFQKDKLIEKHLRDLKHENVNKIRQEWATLKEGKKPTPAPKKVATPRKKAPSKASSKSSSKSPKGSHVMPDGSIMKDSDMPKKTPSKKKTYNPTGKKQATNIDDEISNLMKASDEITAKKKAPSKKASSIRSGIPSEIPSSLSEATESSVSVYSYVSQVKKAPSKKAVSKKISSIDWVSLSSLQSDPESSESELSVSFSRS